MKPLLLALFFLPVAAPAQQTPDAPVRILIDQPARAVEYQLGRLTNEELARVERKDDDARYRLVYVALLTRSGLAQALRDEAVVALVKLDRATPAHVLLEALAKIPSEDGPTADALARMVIAQPLRDVPGARDALMGAVAATEATPALRAAYGALVTTFDYWPIDLWNDPAQRPAHVIEMLNSVPLLPLVDNLAMVRSRLAASTRELLASPATPADVRTAAIRALLRVPESWWGDSDLEPIVQMMVALARSTPASQRTESPAADAIQLGERLLAFARGAAGAGLRRELRALGVQVVTIEAVPEQMRFDVNWFVVEAGKPVQIVLVNPDNMPHNLVLGKPGSLETIGTAAMTMSMPADPAVKPYVPAGPLVVAATGLVNAGGTERLNLTAPTAAGEYPYACTFPGHWARMYGVMLVVENLEAWEAAQTTPTDPMTKRPFASRTAR
jgi:azurin